MRTDPGSTERVCVCTHVSERDDVARDDVNAYIETVEITLFSIIVGLPSQQISWMSEVEKVSQE